MFVMIGICIIALCLILLGWHLSHAQEGYEDSDGFHFGRPERK